MKLKIMKNGAPNPKLQEALDAEQKRCRERTISVNMIMQELNYIERQLGISKKAMTGICVEVDVNAQNFPNAYRYVPHSTWFAAERTKSEWVVTKIYRFQTARYGHGHIISLTEDAKAAILDKMSDF